MKRKYVSADGATAISDQLRAEGKKLVFTNGCFDLLHIGHVRYLRAARSLGDVLIVAVNGDASVRELKGEGRPLNSENDRAELIAALECVDYVVVFPQVRATQLLAQVRPAIYVKGGDYTTESLHPDEREVLEITGAEVRILPFQAGFSTSGLIEKISDLHL